ncbi:MAG TPA: ATP-dependent RNA helicase HrpA, partial [Gammaproteobacteria bacterium]|nr:ATP-dependent RNA helicase HrpA [Gammaproteobacteria bacterium]
MSWDKIIADCLYKDRGFFQKKLNEALSVSSHTHREHLLSKLRARIDHSISIRSAKFQQIPPIAYPDLPIMQAKAEILKAMEDNQVIIVAAETGSGKSTQIPKFCLELQRGINGFIGHTQPRRLAARSIADRIAQELHQPVGKSVGFAVRFQDMVNPTTHIKVMTDGILLNEIQYDKELLNYDTLIIDEAHERSLNIDLLLGYVRYLLEKGSHLKVIITSATIALEAFSQFFYHAPIIEVPGKLYPVETFYRSKEEQEDYFSHVKRVVEEAMTIDYGDILIFLSGEGEIHEAQKLLTLQNYKNTEILPLYAKLNLDAQRKIFKTSSKRRIILATNVAETSITVPNVRFVIDLGFARISRYNYRSKIQRLPIEPISQASCKQRQGRAGRTSAGVCFRLYDESDFLTRPLFTEPEIKRSNLASVLLKMGQLQLGDLQNFPLLDPPEKSHIQDGLKQLERLEAYKENKLTPLGHQMAKFPLDPKSSKILIKASQLNALAEMLIILSGLSIQDPREYPKEFLEKATQIHSKFNHPKSQFLSYVNVWQHLHEVKKMHSQKQLRIYFHKNFLSYVRFLEWQDIHQQLSAECKKMGLMLNEKAATYEEIHKALLSGFFENIGVFDAEKKCYMGVRGVQFTVHKQALPIKPKWIMAAQFIETQKVYAACVAELDPTWILNVVPHLCKTHPGEMFWDPKSGFVKNYESITFFGITIIARRAVLAKMHESSLQAIFIREALIEHALEEFP